VEDERNIRELVSLHLGLEGYECIALENGLEALDRLGRDRFDLVVLDLMIPGLDGVSVCRAIRKSVDRGGGAPRVLPENRDVPVLMLTAKREENDRVIGLESGADDYLTKPFGIRELVARARALLRRPRGFASADARQGSGQSPLRIHDIEIHPARRRVVVSGREVELTTQEFNLLVLLASHPGIVFSREALLARIWKEDTHVTDRSVDTLVKRLRQRIERTPAEPRYVLTVWGAGYKMSDV
jgi:two-component system OmpR family response regulator/two-component system alkaline phosphatase synthesis response regulator PhoP